MRADPVVDLLRRVRFPQHHVDSQPVERFGQVVLLDRRSAWLTAEVVGDVVAVPGDRLNPPRDVTDQCPERLTGEVDASTETRRQVVGRDTGLLSVEALQRGGVV